MRATEAGGGAGEVAIAVPGGWQPSALCRNEIARLAPEATWAPRDTAQLEGPLPPAKDTTVLHEEGRAIIAATGKAADGIVSRHINRPMSQAMTRLCLRWPGMRPAHATAAAGVIGGVMLFALLFGGASGAVIGALLFQLASIVDGVDGEVARATHRASARGAMLDSMVDALTNIGFVAGLSYNVFERGDTNAAIAGTVGFVILAAGKVILGRQARRDGGDFTFNALKDRFRQRPSPFKQWLIWITMRDFYALAACLIVVFGGAAILLHAFAVVAAGWFAVLFATLRRERAGMKQSPL